MLAIDFELFSDGLATGAGDSSGAFLDEGVVGLVLIFGARGGR